MARISPLIDRWYFTDLPTPRAASAVGLQTIHNALPGAGKAPSSTHSDPLQALQAALAAADPADRIVVFGSFYTVGGVLKDGIPRLQAKHVSA